MALPTTLKGTQLYIKIGDGASPEVFLHPCLINSERGVTFTSTTNDIIVPDCSNPDDPAWRQVVKDVLSVNITGAGILDTVLGTIQTYTTWWKTDTTKKIQVWLGTIGYWEFDAKLTEWELGGERGNKVTNTLTIASDGAVSDFTSGA
jgi:hypothetical protein